MKPIAALACVLAGLATCFAVKAATPVGSLQNVSLLVDVPAGGVSPAVGFVVTGAATPFLIRAVGPSLAGFGVSHAAAAPQLQFFDSQGRQLTAIGMPGVTPAGTAPTADFAGAMSALGAFPISSADYFIFVSIPPGSYSVRATDRTGGTVLIELYQGAPPASTGVMLGALVLPMPAFPAP